MRIVHRYLLREYLTNYLYCSVGFWFYWSSNFLFEISNFQWIKGFCWLICLLVYYQIPYLLMDVFRRQSSLGVSGLGRVDAGPELDDQDFRWNFPSDRPFTVHLLLCMVHFILTTGWCRRLISVTNKKLGK